MEVKAEATRVDDIVITVQIEGKVSEFQKLLSAESKDVPWPLYRTLKDLVEQQLTERFKLPVAHENSP